MSDSDIHVTGGHVQFFDVRLDHPLRLAGGTVDHVTMATVKLAITGSSGVPTHGTGASMLSVPWSWPSMETFDDRDRRMRALTTSIAESVIGTPGADPFVHWAALFENARNSPEAQGVPTLAVLLSLAAVDNALHDGWSRAADIPLYEMYTPEVLTAAGRALIDADMPQLALESATARSALPVQYVVGLADSIDSASAVAVAIQSAGVRHLKIKLSGESAADATRVVKIHDEFTDVIPALDFSLDANEGYRDTNDFRALVGEILSYRPEVWDAISYIEQPVPREVDDIRNLYPVQLPESERRPIVLDEGHTTPEQLRTVMARGWSGVAVKASKGQSLAILTHAYARSHGMFVVPQDLTAVDRALEHSAGLTAALPFSSEVFECNSLQFAPNANSLLALRNPGLVTIRDGRVRPGSPASRGLYGDDNG